MRSFALASGSSGNCFYVESKSGFRALVDVGISYKRVCELLLDRGVKIKDINAVFITHEHSDHCVGLDKFSKEHDACVYLSQGTFDNLGFDISNKKIVREHEVLKFEDMKVFVLSKAHDSAEAVSYVFENGTKLGIFTDLGVVSDEIKYILKDLDVIYFEASYCDEVAKKRDLHYTYVNRLVSDVGHLSIADASEVLAEVCNDNQRIVLSHISTNANFYENAYVYVRDFLAEKGLFPKLSVSFQDEPTDWF